MTTPDLREPPAAQVALHPVLIEIVGDHSERPEVHSPVRPVLATKSLTCPPETHEEAQRPKLCPRDARDHTLPL
jgi:hypothetical protein